MSVSATMAESWTVSRFAILRITVPPPNVGLEITVRSTASSSSIEPVIGARTWVSSIASLAVWRPASALTTAALAVAWARLEDSYSVSEIDCDRYKASDRNLGVFHRILGGLEAGLGVDHGRASRRVGQVGGLVFGLRDRLRPVQGFAPPELRRGRLQLRASFVQRGLCLGEVLLGNARVDPGQRLALSHLVARLDGHLDDLAPCLGLDDERENRLHHARRARGDDDVATCHRDCLVERCRLGLLARGGAAHEDGDTPGTEQALHDFPFVCTSRSTSPSRK